MYQNMSIQILEKRCILTLLNYNRHLLLNNITFKIMWTKEAQIIGHHIVKIYNNNYWSLTFSSTLMLTQSYVLRRCNYGMLEANKQSITVSVVNWFSAYFMYVIRNYRLTPLCSRVHMHTHNNFRKNHFSLNVV